MRSDMSKRFTQESTGANILGPDSTAAADIQEIDMIAHRRVKCAIYTNIKPEKANIHWDYK